MSFEILELPPNPEPKTLKIEVGWYAWETIKELMKKYDWDLEEVFGMIFDYWLRALIWLEREDGDGEFTSAWEAILEYEAEHRRDVEDAMAGALDVDPSFYDEPDPDEGGDWPW